ncbi:hypothetical protein CY35_04G110900 [Sphagnum magellanicum]|nr:hypothetical protein CY35_04G110900 [Sphagnum magellanicum]
MACRAMDLASFSHASPLLLQLKTSHAIVAHCYGLAPFTAPAAVTSSSVVSVAQDRILSCGGGRLDMRGSTRKQGSTGTRSVAKSNSRTYLSLRNLFTESESTQKQDQYAVGDFMTRREDLVVVEASTTVDEALELLVSHRITGLPVVDDTGRLVGVVSDYDLLALDSISGNRSRETETGLFPEAGRTWKAFKEIQKLLLKTHGKTVGEVMTPSPLVVRESTNLEDAARVLLDTKFRRLPVVDDAGKLVGLLTRGNVVRAALTIKQAADNNSAGGI